MSILTVVLIGFGIWFALSIVWYVWADLSYRASPERIEGQVIDHYSKSYQMIHKKSVPPTHFVTADMIEWEPDEDPDMGGVAVMDIFLAEKINPNNRELIIRQNYEYRPFCGVLQLNCMLW